MKVEDMTNANEQKAFINDLTGLEPINLLLLDEDISEIMVNGPNQVYCESKGKLMLSSIHFRDNEHVMNVIKKMANVLGREIDENSPMIDARLSDGSKVNAIIPPLALNGPTLTIRKSPKAPLQINELIHLGTITKEIAIFLEACVKAKVNIFVSGGTGSGKTTTLNTLSNFIPNDERIVTVEEIAELQLGLEQVVSPASNHSGIESKSGNSIHDLVSKSFGMKPDRVIIGEVRGEDALDMLQMMKGGLKGSLATVLSNCPMDLISRLETMIQLTGVDLTVKDIREEIVEKIDIIIHQSRLKDGSRKIINITEVQGLDGDNIKLQDIFIYKQDGVNAEGKIIGQIMPTGVKPKLLERIQESGINIPSTLFKSYVKGEW